MGKGKTHCGQQPFVSPSALPGLAPDEYDRFMNGDCWLLAKAISDKTGWPILAVGDAEDPEGERVHAVVELPDGRLLDADGIHEPELIFELYDSEETEVELYPQPEDPGWSYKDGPCPPDLLERATQAAIDLAR